MPINGIVGSASRGTSWRTFPCCSLEAGTYLPCWVCSCQGGNCRRFQLNGGKILKDAFRNKLIFDGQRRYYPFKKINLFCRQPMLCGGVFIHKMNTARTSPAGRINRVSKRQFLNVAVDCSTRHIKTFASSPIFICRRTQSSSRIFRLRQAACTGFHLLRLFAPD